MDSKTDIERLTCVTDDKIGEATVIKAKIEMTPYQNTSPEIEMIMIEVDQDLQQ